MASPNRGNSRECFTAEERYLGSIVCLHILASITFRRAKMSTCACLPMSERRLQVSSALQLVGGFGKRS